ncbi:MAG TPA: phage tail terminator-like protein, partial [Thermomicrobiales bacterium]|nr:phage tail terminator-like protein [Thermomicrobiales bacterium]
SVAKPGLPFAPTSGTAYLRANLMPSPTDAITVDGLTNEYRGIFQISVYHPEGGGILQPFETAALLTTYFETGTSLQHEGTTFTIQAPPHIGPALDEPGWIMIPVSIRYRAFLTP